MKPVGMQQITNSRSDMHMKSSVTAGHATSITAESQTFHAKGLARITKSFLGVM